MICLEPQMSRGMIGQSSMLEVIDVVLSKFDAGKLEEPLPTDALDPFTDTLVRAGIACPHGNDVLYRLDHLGPTWWIVGDERDRQLGERGRAACVRHLASNPD